MMMLNLGCMLLIQCIIINDIFVVQHALAIDNDMTISKNRCDVGQQQQQTVNQPLEEQQMPTCRTTQQKQQRPNIILIIIDDLGSNDIGYHGSGIHTPNIDSLIVNDNGILLTNYYVLPYCSPTRTAILSGRYPLHTGCHTIIKGGDTQGLPIDEVIIPQILRNSFPSSTSSHQQKPKTQPYMAHAIGKWHVGHAFYEQLPTYRGFQSFFGYYRGWNDYYTHYTGDSISQSASYDLHYDTQEFCNQSCSQYIDERGNYSTHVFTREAIRVIQDHSTSNNKKMPKQQNKNINDDDEEEEQPLFLYLAYQAVHAPEEVPEHYVQPYMNISSFSTQRQIYAGMLSAVDEGIGNITQYMKEHLKDMWENTVLIITTDNGGPTGICAVQGSMNVPPRRGGKCTIWEGGTTGDAIIAGPYFTNQRLQQLYKQQQMKRKVDADNNPTSHSMDRKSYKYNEYPYLFHAVDWLPTIAAMANIQEPYGNALDKPIDGVNQWDMLLSYNTDSQLSSVPSSLPREEVFVGYASFNSTWYGPAIRWKEWKLLQGTSGGPELSTRIHPDYVVPVGYKEPARGGSLNDTYQLYNVVLDPGESNDVSDKYPHIVQYLQNKLQSYQKTYVPPILPYDMIACGGPYNGISYNNKQYGTISHPWCKKLIVYE